MARKTMTGFDVGFIPTSYTTSPDGQSSSSSGGSRTRVSGSLSVGGSSGTFRLGFSGSPYDYMRFYFYTEALPTSTQTLVTATSSTKGQLYALKVLSGGALQLVDYAGNQVGSSTYQLPTNQWVQIEVCAVADTVGTASSYGELRVDGVSITNGNVWSGSAGGIYTYSYLDFTFISTGSSSYFDDFVQDDAVWVGDSDVILFSPNSDVSIGAWTAGAGATTNLWDAVNNVQPIGSSTLTNTSQIRVASTTTQTYVAATPSYAAKGVGAFDVIKAIRILACHAEEGATGTKTGVLGLNANPSASGTSFTYGNDAGAAGVWPDSVGLTWPWTSVVTASVSGIDITQSLQLSVQASTASATRFADVCFLGAYVEVQRVSPPPVPGTLGNFDPEMRLAGWF